MRAFEKTRLDPILEDEEEAQACYMAWIECVVPCAVCVWSLQAHVYKK